MFWWNEGVLVSCMRRVLGKGSLERKKTLNFIPRSAVCVPCDLGYPLNPFEPELSLLIKKPKIQIQKQKTNKSPGWCGSVD